MLIKWKEEQDEVKEILGEEYTDYNLVMATTFGNPIGAGAVSYTHLIFFWQGLNIIPAPFPQSVRILIYHPDQN